MRRTVTISTAIAYPNAKPHLGHALEFIHADVLSRFYRMSGCDVFFTTGTDEHGTKIYKTAKEAGKDTKEFIDSNVIFFKEMCELLEISYSSFLRTTDDMLKEGARKLWKKLVASGDIYKAQYEGLYCYGCENYMLEKDLIDGMCPTHKRAPEKVKEENYFFKLTKYLKRIEKLIIDGELTILAPHRSGEILNMMKDMQDVSFSRPRSVLPWGVGVPDDEDHVMYVWCDALANYLTGLDFLNESENYKKFWPTTINIIGKDIMKFHAVVWPAMLMSAELPLPKSLYIHGFVTSEGEKMSKSLGNVVDPIEYAKLYGGETLRFYLLSQIPTQDDGDFSKGRFFESYNAHLANTIGNLVSRTSTMVQKYFDCELALCECEKFEMHEVEFQEYVKAIENYDLRLAFEKILNIAMYANKYIDQSKPWEIAKSGDKEKLQSVLYHLLESIKIMTYMMTPFLPEKSREIFGVLGLPHVTNFDAIFTRQKIFKINVRPPLFPKIEINQ